VLSRTADHVYWLGRYAERAENLARTLDVQYRLSLVPREPSSDALDWRRTLATLGFEAAYAQTLRRPVRGASSHRFPGIRSRESVEHPQLPALGT
jgi:uncharacterized alpha-E superfamily protein